METLFGIPITSLMLGLLAAFGLGALIFAFSAFRNRVAFRLGVRNMWRRPAETVLIVVGLMLATLLFSAALGTGDTMSYSIRKLALENLGPVDEILQAEGRDVNGGPIYFDEEVVKGVRRVLDEKRLADSVAPFIIETAPVVSRAKRQSEPNVQVLGIGTQYGGGMAGRIRDGRGRKLEVLTPGEIFLSTRAAEKLDVGKGDMVEVYLAAKVHSLQVAGVYGSGGYPAEGPSLIIPLDQLQDMMGRKGLINTIILSNKGDDVQGGKLSEKVEKALAPVVEEHDLKVEKAKQEALDEGDQAAGVLTAIFVVFSQLSISAGILLIFLIFVMLAAERRGELGMARALGARRSQVIKMFVYEGAFYSLVSAAVGALLGVGIGWAMVRVMAAAIGDVEGFTMSFYFNPRSLVIAYTMGMVLTFFVVLFSSWRASRINIVRAIRDIPEPKVAHRSLLRLILLVLMVLAGAGIGVSGVQANHLGTFELGTSLVIIGVPLIARRFGLPERAAFSIAGIGLLLWWLVPGDVLWDRIFPFMKDMKQGIELFFISGIMLVIGGVWTVIYNSDVLLRAIVAVFGRVKGLPPVLKTAVSYPMQNRFRTGMALTMFALVVFTMVFMGAIIGMVGSVFDDTVKLSGGFDVFATTGYNNPVSDPQAVVDEDFGRDIEAVASAAVVPLEMQQVGVKSKKWHQQMLTGVTREFGENVSYKLSTMAEGYKDSQDVWRALQEEPNVAIVHYSLVPTKAQYSVQIGGPSLKMQGFYAEDKRLPKVYLEVKEPAGKTVKLRVIGVAEQLDVLMSNGVFTSKKTIDSFLPGRVPATVHYYKLRDGADSEKAAARLARKLESFYFANGAQTTVLAKQIRDMGRSNTMMNQLMQGFMGLGLLVGISALGVIAARSVVERRHEIGVLRAIGFRRRMVQGSFLIESSFVALLGIAIGGILAILLAGNVYDVIIREMQGAKLDMPWLQVAGIAVVAYVASLLTTYLPARHASKVYPAEALRYE